MPWVEFIFKGRVHIPNDITTFPVWYHAPNGQYDHLACHCMFLVSIAAKHCSAIGWKDDRNRNSGVKEKEIS